MNVYITVILFVLLVLFLILSFVFKSRVFAIFAFVILIIIVYELNATGIEYPSGTNSTITAVNSSVTTIGSTDRYDKLNAVWNNSLLAIFAIFAFYLLLVIITATDEED